MAESLRRLFSSMPHWGAIVCRSTKPAVAEMADLAQRAQVARHVGADFEHIAAFEQLEDGFGQRNPVEPEQVADRPGWRVAAATRGTSRPGGTTGASRCRSRSAAVGRGACKPRRCRARARRRQISPRNSMAGSRAVCSLLILSMKLFTGGHAVKVPTNYRINFHKSCPSYD